MATNYGCRLYSNKSNEDTQLGRSRAQHVRDREADIERAKKWGPGHLRRSKREARRAEPIIWDVFSCNGAKRGDWRDPKGRADALAVVDLWSKEDRATRAEPTSPFLVPSDQKRQILALVVSP